MGSLREFAESQMENVIRESESSSSEAEDARPGPSRLINAPRAASTSTRALQKVIKTSKNLTLVGEVRPPSSGSDEEIVDVAEGIDRLNIRSYRKTETGLWEEIGSSRPSTVQVSQAKSLSSLQADARRLLERLSEVIAHNRATATTSKIPVEIEEILDFKARSMKWRSRLKKMLWVPTLMSSPLIINVKQKLWRKLPNSRRRPAGCVPRVEACESALSSGSRLRGPMSSI